MAGRITAELAPGERVVMLAQNAGVGVGSALALLVLAPFTFGLTLAMLIGLWRYAATRQVVLTDRRVLLITGHAGRSIRDQQLQSISSVEAYSIRGRSPRQRGGLVLRSPGSTMRLPLLRNPLTFKAALDSTIQSPGRPSPAAD